MFPCFGRHVNLPLLFQQTCACFIVVLAEVRMFPCCFGRHVNVYCCFGRPAYATPRILDKAGLTLSDISVFEYHEAFAVSCLCFVCYTLQRVIKKRSMYSYGLSVMLASQNADYENLRH